MTTAFGIAWLRAFLDRASGLTFDDVQAAQVADLAERALVGLFDVAEEVAVANGRSVILPHDLPLTRGMRLLLGEVTPMARDVDIGPLLVFLADAGVPGPLDETVRAEVPRLMAALLLLAGRVIAIVDPELATSEERLDRLLKRTPTRPTRWELERTTRIVEMVI